MQLFNSDWPGTLYTRSRSIGHDLLKPAKASVVNGISVTAKLSSLSSQQWHYYQAQQTHSSIKLENLVGVGTVANWLPAGGTQSQCCTAPCRIVALQYYCNTCRWRSAHIEQQPVASRRWMV
jgi:hypothetical protein